MADLDVEATVARLAGLDVGFSVAAGEVLAVLGPNGAGKSSIAAVITGLLHADRADVAGRRSDLTDTGQGISVPSTSDGSACCTRIRCCSRISACWETWNSRPGTAAVGPRPAAGGWLEAVRS